MKDLKEKQAFWAEQLPIFKEHYIMQAQLDVLYFDDQSGNFEIKDESAIDFEKEDFLEAYHSVNSGWSMWLRAKTHEKAKLTYASGFKYQIQPMELPENIFNWFHPDIELFDTIEDGAEACTKEQWEQLKVNLGVEIEPQILDYDDIPNIPDDAIVWSNWKPEPPEDGLFLIAAFDSESGPVLWWANPNRVI